jgi:hypothetical protein
MSYEDYKVGMNIEYFNVVGERRTGTIQGKFSSHGFDWLEVNNDSIESVQVIRVL